MKKISGVVGRATQTKASRAVKHSKKTNGPHKGLAKSPRPQAQDGPVNPELKRLLTTPSVFERLVDYRPDLLNLRDPRYAAEYLDQALASGDTDTLKLAVRDFVEAMKPRTLRGRVLRRLYELWKTTPNLSIMKTAQLEQMLQELESGERR